ncbi:MAG TPA: hypothetical protein VEJ63_07340 [Planctomycetota bacterium]|nr:hypothetical protein [Planctomycetota bacterium]
MTLPFVALIIIALVEAVLPSAEANPGLRSLTHRQVGSYLLIVQFGMIFLIVIAAFNYLAWQLVYINVIKHRGDQAAANKAARQRLPTNTLLAKVIVVYVAGAMVSFCVLVFITALLKREDIPLGLSVISWVAILSAICVVCVRHYRQKRGVDSLTEPDPASADLVEAND